MTGRPPDVVDLLSADHHELARLVTELESGDLVPADRGRLAEVVVAELVRHSVAEEEYLYPAAKEALPDSGPVTDRGLSTHRETEAAMKRLQATSAGTPEFDAQVRQLAVLVRDHIEVEETSLLPRLRAECDPAELRRLAVLVGMARDAAPTRPHPSVPHRPPWNLLLSPGMGIVDRLRDALGHRPTRPDDVFWA